MFSRFLSAAADGDCAVLSQIIRSGFDINEQDLEGGFTALMGASLFGHLNAVDLLLISGADINIKDQSGMIALDYAVNESHLGVIRRMSSDPGLDRTTRDNQGHTVLVNAVIARNFEVVELLLIAGFDPNANCPSIVNPLLYAMRKGDRAIAELLMRFGATSHGKI
jgi:ankyrin repeat protein